LLPWLLLDEAHVAFEGVAAAALRRLVTRGRGPGVSLVAATQRPSALPAVAVSQADILIVHRLTGRADREALADARPASVGGALDERMPSDVGEALVIDDATESVHVVDVRERRTPHDGRSPRASDRASGSETVE
jgi:DNA helicase HerA-like ATPase